MRVHRGKPLTELAKKRAVTQLRQQDIADELGISQGRYSAIENGHRTPDVVIAHKIAKILDCAVEDLWPVAKPKAGSTKGKTKGRAKREARAA